MRRSRGRAIGVSLGIGLVLGSSGVIAGCGNSTAPAPPSFNEARHLDTLARDAASAGEFDRFRLLLYPIAVLAQGVQPGSMSLTVDGASQTYQVAVLEIVGTTAGTTPTPSDSLFAMVAWTGDDVTQLVYLLVAPSSQLIDAALLRDTSANVALTTASVTASLAGVEGACRTLQLATASSLLRGTCKRATVNASFDLTFAGDSTFPDTTFVLSSQAIPAVRLVLPASNGGQDIITRLGRVGGVLRPRP